jgi:hypothetical protein
MVVTVIGGGGRAKALESLSIQGQEPYGAQEVYYVYSLYPRIVQKWFK